MTARTSTESTPRRIFFVVYLLALTAYLLAGLFPNHRIWGINVWGYFPIYVSFTLFGLGLAAALCLRSVSYRRRWPADAAQKLVSSDKTYLVVSACLIVLFGLGFYFPRARMHFLGDGYAALSSLASDNPLVKPRGPGEGFLHVWLKSAIGGDAETAALLSFQAFSISAGILLLITVAIFAGVLFERTRDRVLFLLGLTSSGYMLLFFGYIEYYSLFVLSVAVYSLMGLLVVKERINRWVILPVVGLAIFFHVLGATLIPSAVYLLAANSRFGNWLSRLNRKTKLTIMTITAAILVSLFYHYYLTDYYFRFAFVPLFENRFTVEGYTLFSTKHLLDYFNLLILLLPGLPLVVATLLFLPLRRIFRQREYRYLAVLVLSTLGAVFIFDPKLGMARDWDLFSFSGVPLTLLCYYSMLDGRNRFTSSGMLSALAIALGLLSLAPRVVSQVMPDISLARFRNYIDLDREKNRNSRILLVNHYRDIGDTATAQVELTRWKMDHPEELLMKKCNELYYKEKRLNETVFVLRKALELNPVYPDAYSFLGFCFLDLKKYDSALILIKIANGLNPYSASTLNNLGFAYQCNREYLKAEKAFLQAYAIDGTMFEPIYNLAYLYRILNKKDKYRQFLVKAGSREDAPVAVVKELGDHYLGNGEYAKAAEAYELAIQRGLDSAYVVQLKATHPGLRKWLH